MISTNFNYKCLFTKIMMMVMLNLRMKYYANLIKLKFTVLVIVLHTKYFLDMVWSIVNDHNSCFDFETQYNF